MMFFFKEGGNGICLEKLCLAFIRDPETALEPDPGAIAAEHIGTESVDRRDLRARKKGKLL